MVFSPTWTLYCGQVNTFLLYIYTEHILAHLFFLFLSWMFCKETKCIGFSFLSRGCVLEVFQYETVICCRYGVGYGPQKSRRKWVGFSHLHCLQPGSPAVKLFSCLLPADSSFCPSSLRPLFLLVTLAKMCLCSAERKHTNWLTLRIETELS